MGKSILAALMAFCLAAPMAYAETSKDQGADLAKKLALWSASEVLITTGTLPEDSPRELHDLVREIEARLRAKQARKTP